MAAGDVSRFCAVSGTDAAVDAVACAAASCVLTTVDSCAANWCPSCALICAEKADCAKAVDATALLSCTTEERRTTLGENRMAAAATLPLVLAFAWLPPLVLLDR